MTEHSNFSSVIVNHEKFKQYKTVFSEKYILRLHTGRDTIPSLPGYSLDLHCTMIRKMKNGKNYPEKGLFWDAP